MKIQQSYKFRKSTFFIFFLFIVWLSIQLYFFLKSGVRLSVDSEMYLEDAKGLLNFDILKDRSIWYLGYSAFVASVLFFYNNLIAVVLIQMLLSGIAAVCIYNVVAKISSKHITGCLAVLLYLLWFKMHEWNVFLYTESLFTSLCIISFTLMVLYKSWWMRIAVAFLLVFTFFVRPTGFGLLLGTFGYLIYQRGRKKSGLSKPFFFILLLSGFSVAVLLLNYMLKDYTLIESYTKAEIIYPNNTLGIKVPDDLAVPSKDLPPLIRIVVFGMQNPLYFIKISGFKLLLFFANIKPYFSLWHNLFIVVFLYSLYTFAIRGFFVFPSAHKAERIFILLFILTQGFTVMLTTENWDGRFLIPVLPFIFILASFGLMDVFYKIRKETIFSAVYQKRERF